MLQIQGHFHTEPVFALLKLVHFGKPFKNQKTIHAPETETNHAS